MFFFVDIIWKKKSLLLNHQQLEFHGDSMLPNNIMELESPYEFFRYFFTDQIIETIASESNLYSVQQDPNKPANISTLEIKQYLGIIIYMSVIHLPNIRSYWSEDLGIDKIIQTMTVNRFEKIRQHLHFNNNETIIPKDHPDHDRLHKIRPLIEHLNERFCSIPLESSLSIDEQMCSTKVRHFMKQYMPNKPHKWGFKLFVLCGVSGFSYKFELYAGQENDPSKRLQNEPDLGASSNVVVRLSRIIPKNKNYRLFFDNYYTSLPLLIYLSKQGIYSLGTIRRNRLPNCKLPDEGQMKKEARGTTVEYVGSADGVDLSCVAWKDNKLVTMLSTFVGTHPQHEVQRFDRKQRKTVTVLCPHIIFEYNRHMGGVDLLDSIIGRYKIRLRSKKWYFRLFYHLLDLTVVNSWLLYRRVEKQKNNSKYLPLSKFRTQLAESLCRVGQKSATKRGRPSLTGIEQMLHSKKSKGPTQHCPVKEVRLDQIAHWPIWADKQMRCKFPGCKGYTQTMCQKCGVALCYTKKVNCFKAFHEVE